jgi:antitoxin component YwqK of YwqJK toxin-antitoxin module
MEVDFMEQPVRFRSSLLFLFLLALAGCNNPVAAPLLNNGLLNSANENFNSVNGVTQLNGQPYSGAVFTLYPNGKDTADLRNYLQGMEDGVWKKYYENGKLKESRKFIKGNKEGEYLAWWPNGNMQLMYHFDGDEYEGACREWNESGLLVKEMNYKKGHEEGLQQWRYDNGKIKANYIIQDGRRFGLLGTKNCVNVSDSIFDKH